MNAGSVRPGCRPGSTERRWHGAAVTAVLTIAASACAGPPAPSPGAPSPAAASPAPAGAAETVAAIRDTYDRGFDLVMAKVEEEADTSVHVPLRGLKRFREELVRWAELRGNQYLSLEPGFDNGGWLAVVPPGHPRIPDMSGILQMDGSTSLPVIQIQPRRVTEVWAGLFLIHEVSHLADRVLGVEPADPDRREFLMGELRAYGLEVMAANVLTEGALDRRLDALLGEWQPADVEALVDRVVRIATADVEALEVGPLAAPSASEAETGLRSGFYAVALLNRYGQTRDVTMTAMLRGFDRFLTILTQPAASPPTRP